MSICKRERSCVHSITMKTFMSSSISIKISAFDLINSNYFHWVIRETTLYNCHTSFNPFLFNACLRLDDKKKFEIITNYLSTEWGYESGSYHHPHLFRFCRAIALQKMPCCFTLDTAASSEYCEKMKNNVFCADDALMHN